MNKIFLDLVARIPCAGGRDDGYGELLYGTIVKSKPDTVVEVGSYHGYTTVWMAQALKDNQATAAAAGVSCGGRVYAIDNWSLMQESRETIQDVLKMLQLEHLVTIIDGDSLSVEWPRVVDFAFLDGNHSYNYVKRETAKCIARGAQTICLHDSTSWEGIARYVEELRNDSEFREQFDIYEEPRGHGFTTLKRILPKAPPQFLEADYPLGYLVTKSAA